MSDLELKELTGNILKYKEMVASEKERISGVKLCFNLCNDGYFKNHVVVAAKKDNEKNDIKSLRKTNKPPVINTKINNTKVAKINRRNLP